jgi:NAD(P)-dependent dehydrogenase (short-subunit alcohol dehydrogenase family)
MSSDSVNGHASKTVIVTGGASGIGLAMVEHFASQGHNVAVFDVNLDVGKQVVASIVQNDPQAKVQFQKCDVSSWKNQAEAFKNVYNEFGRIDIVMANAGISEQGGSAMGSIEEDEPKEPNLKIMDVDLSGVIYSEWLFFSCKLRT